jgi:exopolysaccharide biosynthesis protein
MRNILFFRIFVVIILIYTTQNTDAQLNGFKRIKWEKEQIAPGLTWKYSHTFINDTVPQNINMLIISLRKRELFISYDHTKNIPLSTQAEKAGAMAAVNAGFFNMRDGGSVTYIKTGGVILETDTAKQWRRNINMSGAVLIDTNGLVFIDRARTNSWYDSHTEYSGVLVSGPLLLLVGDKLPLPSTPLVVNSHPRTAIGIKGRNKVVLLTVDGRAKQAAGMTLYMLADLMVSLRCSDAVNLDGGGSTAMWINGKSYKGIVSMPSDNRSFDHGGERAVSDILIVK